MRRREFFSLLGMTALLAGCQKRQEQRASGGKELSAEAYQLLTDREKVRYKDIVLRIPASWGGVLLPNEAGPYASPVDKTVHGGDIATLMGLYNQSLFELQHPRVKIEYINFDMWTENFRSALAVALSARRAPAYYIARDLPQTIEQGMYADLTELMKTWDQFDRQPEASVRQGRVDGHLYTLAANELGASVVRYRKDWFKEAGILNERGEPGPRADWTWDDFRKIAAKLTNPAKNRYGFAGEMGSFQFNEANDLDLFIPDPSGKNTWRFNGDDPLLLESLLNARALVNTEKSVTCSVSMGWFEWHNEFDAGRAGMVMSFAPHIPREALTSPAKMGKGTLYAETVGMAPPPRGRFGFDPLRPVTNPIGFDPTLSPDELKAAFDWCRSWFYGDLFVNRMRAATQDARLRGQTSVVYAEVLALPYQPTENLLDKPLEQVFPADYLATYQQLRRAPAPPLPREFGLREPPAAELTKALKALYSEAITSPGAELKALITKHGQLIDTNLLTFRKPDDTERLKRYIAARTAFYEKEFPAYFEAIWKKQLEGPWHVK